MNRIFKQTLTYISLATLLLSTTLSADEGCDGCLSRR